MSINVPIPVPVPVAAPSPAFQPPARLLLEPGHTRAGMLDGAWWPRSRHAEVELTALVAALTAQAGRVFRLSLNHATWDSRPLRIVFGGHVVKIGWFGPNDLHALTATGDFPYRLDLLVVPPAAAPASAEAAMQTASDPSSAARATAVLTAHGIDSSTGTDLPTIRPVGSPPRTAAVPTIGPAKRAATNGHRPGATLTSTTGSSS